MAFLSFDTLKLKSVLSVASLISTPRSTVELFTYTKVTCINTKDVEFAAMNDFVSFVSIVTSANLEDLEPGASFLIKTDLFANAIALTSDALVGIELDLKKNTIVIQGAKSKHNLRINSDLAESFVINVPTTQTESSFTIKSEELLRTIKQAGISLGNPRTVYQPEFLNYCFTIKKESKSLVVATTDRYRVTRMVPEIKLLKTTIEADTKNYLLSPRILSVLDKVSNDETVTFELHPDLVVAKTKTMTVSSRYGEGNYPDYDKIIPASFVCNFGVSTADLLDALKQVQYFARLNAESKAIKLIVKPNDKKIVVSSQTVDGYASEATVDIIKYEGPTDEWEQSYNIDYMYNFVSSLKQTHIVWEANPGKPSVLSPTNEKESLLYLVSGLK